MHTRTSRFAAIAAIAFATALTQMLRFHKHPQARILHAIWLRNAPTATAPTARASPKLAVVWQGQPANVILQKMKDYRDGKLPATVMHQLAKGYSDEQVALMADYFSRQAK